MKRIPFTQADLKSLLHYNQSTGTFKWLKYRSGIRKNLIAGSLEQQGYIVIRIDNAAYKAHRLAWIYVYGYEPENQIDHINRKRDDNRIKNLREASTQCNCRNRNLSTSNTSGVNGVYYHKICNRWYAQIACNGIRIQLGSFKDFCEAVCHRLAAEQCLDWNSCDSNSPAYKYVKKHILKK